MSHCCHKNKAFANTLSNSRATKHCMKSIFKGNINFPISGIAHVKYFHQYKKKQVNSFFWCLFIEFAKISLRDFYNLAIIIYNNKVFISS